jgi:DNA-binding NarL/FixJ family response regulator
MVGKHHPVISGLTIAIISSHHVVCLGLQKIFESRETPRFLVRPYQRMTPDVLLPENLPDVFILDTETERDVTGAITQMRETAPKGKILLLSGFEDKERTREAVGCGVDGVILKVQPPQVVLAAIDALYSAFHNHASPERDGTRFADLPEASKTHFATETRPTVWPDALTEREREVIGLVRQGLSNKDIAYRLSISDSTVRHHLTSIFDKVGVPNRQKLLVHAHQIRSTSA